jgi:hypothetical protein
MRLASTLFLISSVLSACSTTPQQCDLQQPAGSCLVRIDYTNGKFSVCSGEQPADSAPVCMDATLDVSGGKGYIPRRVLLAPGECRVLGVGISSVGQSSCHAFVARPGSGK